MHLDPTGKFVRTDIWREGDYLDLWSVVHFLTGISTAIGLSFFNFGFWPSVVIAALAFTMYEMFEALMDIEETRWNRVLDVVVGLASFVPTLLFFAPLISKSMFFPIFASVLAVNIGLSRIGWHASQKAAALEEKLRAEIAQKKLLFKARATKIEEKLKAEGVKWTARRKRIFRRRTLRGGQKDDITSGTVSA